MPPEHYIDAIRFTYMEGNGRLSSGSKNLTLTRQWIGDESQLKLIKKKSTLITNIYDGLVTGVVSYTVKERIECFKLQTSEPDEHKIGLKSMHQTDLSLIHI